MNRVEGHGDLVDLVMCSKIVFCIKTTGNTELHLCTKAPTLGVAVFVRELKVVVKNVLFIAACTGNGKMNEFCVNAEDEEARNGMIGWKAGILCSEVV